MAGPPIVDSSGRGAQFRAYGERLPRGEPYPWARDEWTVAETWLPRPLVRAVERLAARKGSQPGNVLVEALLDYLEQEGESYGR